MSLSRFFVRPRGQPNSMMYDTIRFAHVVQSVRCRLHVKRCSYVDARRSRRAEGAEAPFG